MLTEIDDAAYRCQLACTGYRKIYTPAVDHTHNLPGFPVGATDTVLANLEAVVGQVYVAVFIARLVGLRVVAEAGQHDEA